MATVSEIFSLGFCKSVEFDPNLIIHAPVHYIDMKFVGPLKKKGATSYLICMHALHLGFTFIPLLCVGGKCQEYAVRRLL